MRLLRQLSVNDELIEPFPFKRELSMQAYLLENPEILNIDDMYSDVQIYNDEVVLKGNEVHRHGSGGRIDIVASFAGEYIGIIELKNEPLDTKHLEQLEDYIRARNQLSALETPILTSDETTDPKWLGVLVGSEISDELREKISKGFAYDGQTSSQRIPIAALTVQRFRSKTGQVYITTDTYFKNTNNANDQTKYFYNGNIYGKGRLVLAIVRDHVAANPAGTYAKLDHEFPKPLQGSSGVFSTLEAANRLYTEKGYKRHFIDAADVLELANGPQVAVSNQWGIGNIGRFLIRAKELGYEIKTL